MNNFDWKYIFRKVLIFFIIFVCLSLLKACKVSAAEKGFRFTAESESYTAISGTTVVPFTTNNQVVIGDNIFNQVAWSGNLITPQTLRIRMLTPNLVADTFYLLGYGVGTQVTGCYSISSVKCEIYNNYVAQAPDLSLNSTWAIKVTLFEPLNNSSWNGDIYLQLSGFGNSGATSFGPHVQIMVWHYYSLGENNSNVVAAIQDTTQAINNVNNSINNDNVDGASSEVDSLLNNSSFNDSSGIQSIINAPLNLINGLTNSCSPIQLTIPYIDTPLTIPCLKQELTNHIPTVVPILSTAINGFIIYRILIDIVHLIKSARNPDDDRIEVLDL